MRESITVNKKITSGASRGGHCSIIPTFRYVPLTQASIWAAMNVQCVSLPGLVIIDDMDVGFCIRPKPPSGMVT